MDDNLSAYSSGGRKANQNGYNIPVYVDEDGQTRFFDSQAYRCCFSIFHAKVGTFVMVTLVFHEIIIGMLYLLSRDEMVYRSVSLHYITVFLSRLIQLLFAGVMYLALWRQRWKYILPFVISQLTFGAYADISTIIMVIGDARSSNSWIKSSDWLTIFTYISSLLAYLIFLVWFMYILYCCCAYFRDRYMQEVRKRGLLNEEDYIDEGRSSHFECNNEK